MIDPQTGYNDPEYGKRIARAAHILGCFDGWKAREILQREGLTADEIGVGAELKNLEREEYSSNCSWYGSPAYGSWPESSLRDQPIRQLLGALAQGRADLLIAPACECKPCKDCDGEGSGTNYCQFGTPSSHRCEEVERRGRCYGHTWKCERCHGIGTDKEDCAIHAEVTA